MGLAKTAGDILSGGVAVAVAATAAAATPIHNDTRLPDIAQGYRFGFTAATVSVSRDRAGASE